MEIGSITPTREVFGNIPSWMRILFYVVIYGSLTSLVWQVCLRVRLWRQGQPGDIERNWRVWFKRLAVYAVAQRRVHRKSLGAVLHILLASGFVVLTIGTTLLAIASQGPINFHHGLYYLVYEITMEIFGVALCLGCILALYRRFVNRPKSLGHSPVRDLTCLGLLLGSAVTGFLAEALRLQYTQVPPNVAAWSVLGHGIQLAFLGNLDSGTAAYWHRGVWWSHALLVAGFFATIPLTRFLHVIVGPANIALRPDRAMGALMPLRLEEVEDSGRVGASQPSDFSRQQLMSLDACMECGRCQDACPAWASGKPLSPKDVVVGLRGAMARRSEAGSLVGSSIAAESVWACTMCQACVEECPVFVGHVDLISDMRRNLVGEGSLSGPEANSVRHVATRFNPYGRPNASRLEWAEGLSVPTVDSNPTYEYLYWVGCAASFDPRAQKVARSLVQLLEAARVNFAVLGNLERCTGDPARRLGDEFLFQKLAEDNIRTLNARGAKKIITACPHCYNTLRNEYPSFGGSYQVHHHSQFLADLLSAGRLRGTSSERASVTFHDPCYLGRVNGETVAPRRILSHISSEVREMPRHGAKTFCCGGGGGRMWMDEPPNVRVSHLRAQEAAETGAETVVTGCPFCMKMMTDAIPNVGGARPMQVVDLAELLLQRQAMVESRPNLIHGSAVTGD